MSKTYKGYELAEALDNGILDKKQRVNSLSLGKLDYKNCTIEFILKDVGTNFLFLNFELIEDGIDIQSIEKIGAYCNIIEKSENEGVLWKMIQSNAKKIDELLEAVKQLDKNKEDKQC